MTRVQNLPDIPNDAIRLIDLIAKALGACMSEQLVQANQMIHEKANDGRVAAAKEIEARLDQALTAVLERQPIYKLGVRKTIIVNIGPFIKPNSLDDTATFISRNKNLVPGKLVQTSDIAITNQPNEAFTAELIKVVQSTVTSDIRLHGRQVSDTFTREQRLHRDRHGMPEDEPCCLFRLMEEDYECPDYKCKKEIAGFMFKCTTCGGKHEVRVFR